MDELIGRIERFEGLDSNTQAIKGYARAERELLSHVKVLVELEWNLQDEHGFTGVDRGSLQHLYHFRDGTGGALCGRVGRYELQTLAEVEAFCCTFCEEISISMSQGWGGRKP